MNKKPGYIYNCIERPPEINGNEYKCHYPFEEESLEELIEGLPEEIMTRKPIVYRQWQLSEIEKRRSDKKHIDFMN